jgi:hypothetical protein
VEGRHWLASWVRWPLLAATVGGLVLGCVLVFPRLLYPPLAATELQARGIQNSKEQVQLQNDRLKLQNDARTTLLQTLAGLLALSAAGGGAYTAWRQLQDNRRQQQRNEELSREQLQLSREQLRQALDTSQEQLQLTREQLQLTREQLRQALDTSQEELRLTRESQLTERFTRAVEQLGSDALDVRLGGIYSLERIAKDSDRDHPTVVEALSAFIRENSRRYIQRPEPDAAAQRIKVEPGTDIQAAVAVLGRLPQRPDVSRGDLSTARLTGARLEGANLAGARA